MLDKGTPAKLAYSIPEAAAAVSIGRSKVYALIAEGAAGDAQDRQADGDPCRVARQAAGGVSRCPRPASASSG